jgi:hypothetical protein
MFLVKMKKKRGNQGAKTDSYFKRYDYYAAHGLQEGFFGLRLVSQRKNGTKKVNKKKPDTKRDARFQERLLADRLRTLSETKIIQGVMEVHVETLTIKRTCQKIQHFYLPFFSKMCSCRVKIKNRWNPKNRTRLWYYGLHVRS